MPSCIRKYSPFFDPNVNKYDHRNAWKRQILGNQGSKWEDRKISGTVFCESGTLFRDLKNGMIGFGHFRLCLPEYALFEQPSLPGRYCQEGIKKKDFPSENGVSWESLPGDLARYHGRLNPVRDRFPVLLFSASGIFL